MIIAQGTKVKVTSHEDANSVGQIGYAYEVGVAFKELLYIVLPTPAIGKDDFKNEALILCYETELERIE